MIKRFNIRSGIIASAFSIGQVEVSPGLNLYLNPDIEDKARKDQVNDS